MRWRAVRHLHSRHDTGFRASTRQNSTANDGRNPRRTGREYLPLYRISANSRSSRTRREVQRSPMRSDPGEFELVSPASLQAAVELLSRQPNTWLPIAGGTDVMVQFSAGTLTARKLLSL